MNEKERIHKPAVEIGEWISIGESYPYVDAVVCTVYDNDSLGNDLEVVYLDGHKAISAYVVWDKGHWEFKSSGPSGVYADNSSRLSEFVNILRGGRK